MTVTVNGKSRTIEDGMTLSLFIQAELASSQGTAVAVDGQVVPRVEWPRFLLRPGSCLEILTAVQGG